MDGGSGEANARADARHAARIPYSFTSSSVIDSAMIANAVP